MLDSELQAQLAHCISLINTLDRKLDELAAALAANDRKLDDLAQQLGVELDPELQPED